MIGCQRCVRSDSSSASVHILRRRSSMRFGESRLLFGIGRFADSLPVFRILRKQRTLAWADSPAFARRSALCAYSRFHWCAACVRTAVRRPAPFRSFQLPPQGEVAFEGMPPEPLAGQLDSFGQEDFALAGEQRKLPICERYMRMGGAEPQRLVSGTARSARRLRREGDRRRERPDRSSRRDRSRPSHR